MHAEEMREEEAYVEEIPEGAMLVEEIHTEVLRTALEVEDAEISEAHPVVAVILVEDVVISVAVEAEAILGEGGGSEVAVEVVDVAVMILEITEDVGEMTLGAVAEDFEDGVEVISAEGEVGSMEEDAVEDLETIRGTEVEVLQIKVGTIFTHNKVLPVRHPKINGINHHRRVEIIILSKAHPLLEAIRNRINLIKDHLKAATSKINLILACNHLNLSNSSSKRTQTTTCRLLKLSNLLEQAQDFQTPKLSKHTLTINRITNNLSSSNKCNKRAIKTKMRMEVNKCSKQTRRPQGIISSKHSNQNSPLQRQSHHLLNQ